MDERRYSVVIWVTHLLGTGHLHRAAAIARALCAKGVETTVVSGGFPVTGIDYGGAELIQLPAVRSPNAEYTILEDESGLEVTEEFLDRRADQLQEILASRCPDVFVTELFPFGRRKFRRELDPVLKTLQQDRPRVPVLCSVRDILEPPSTPEKATKAMQRISAYYDGILVHGDADLAQLEDSFPISPEVASKVAYTGFIGGGAVSEPSGVSERSNEIVVSAGGGAVGVDLYETAFRAAKLYANEGVVWRFLIGHNVPADVFDGYAGRSGKNVIVERARPDFPDLLRTARLSISQAGYNTVCDVLAAGCPCILVPFSAANEREQSLRANSIAKRSRAQVVEAPDLSAETLVACVRHSLDRERDGFAPQSMTGALCAADLIVGFAKGLGQ